VRYRRGHGGASWEISFTRPHAGVDALKAAGKDLRRESAEFRRFLRDVGGGAAAP
jgi:hypothetical protein